MEDIWIPLKVTYQLKNRQPDFGIWIPETLHPAPHLEIIDLKLFITTSLIRLDSESLRLRGIAARNLLAVINSLPNANQ